MLQEHLVEAIKSALGFTPTTDQMRIIELLAAFSLNSDSHSCVLVKGFAGTGKTTLIAAYVKTLAQFKQKFVLLAPTGRAAKVLGEYSQARAYTIHKCIYRQKSTSDGNLLSPFVLDFNKHHNTIFIVDEASMLGNTLADEGTFGSGRLLSDLIEFVNNGTNCRLIFVGDTAQLPPFGTQLSPALNARELGNFDLNVSELTLSQVIRQEIGRAHV